MATRPPTFGMVPPKVKDLLGSSRERGYNSQWERLRNRFIALNPLCAHCEQAGRVTPATEVDHIQPFNGIADPRRLMWNNLQSLCHSCHVAKTHKDRGKVSYG